MENARLITETREALEQQTATAEVLQVINSSPGDLTPVFDAMVERAMRLCDADEGALRIYDGQLFHLAVAHGQPSIVERLQQLGPIPAQRPIFQRLVRGEDIVHIPDIRETETYRNDPAARERIDIQGIRSWLAVGLRKEGALLGAIIVHRNEVRLFTDKQIALLQNFAAQAVIATENARLITETREALEQQTATTEVLQIINSSPGNLAPVFDAMLEKAMLLCDAAFGELNLYDGKEFHVAAVRNLPVAFAAHLQSAPRTFGPGTGPARMLAGEHVRFRTTLFLVSLLYFDRRSAPEKQVAILKNFAAQAVIAMENARLITETREALEQQTATAEVLGVINSSPGDLAPVFDAILERALRLCGGAFGILNTFDGENYHAVSMRGVPAAFAEYRSGNPAGSGAGTAPARILAGENVVHNIDLKDEDAYRRGDPNRRAIVDLGGARSHLAVALRKDNALLGMLTIYRQEVRAFGDKQIALLQNFGAQAVIAMENPRLIT